MKHKLLFGLLSLILCTHLLSQVEDQRLHNQLKIELLRFVNPVNSGVEICYERNYLKGFLATQISGGLLYTIESTTYDRQSGFRVGLQQKWFFTNNKYYQKTIRPYIALIYEYQNSKFDASSYFIDSSMVNSTLAYNNPEYLETFNGTKIFHTFNVGFGAQFVKNHFMFELTGGIGGKNKMIKHYNRSNPTFEMDNGKHGFLKDNSLNEGRSSFVNFILQAKIGICF